MKSKFLILIASMMLLATGSAFGQYITLEDVANIVTDPDSGSIGYVLTESVVQLDVRFQGGGGDDIGGFTNGISLSSPNNPAVTWDSLWAVSLDVLNDAQFDLLLQIDYFSDTSAGSDVELKKDLITGDGMDVAAFSGSKMFGSGFPGALNDTVYTISFGPIPRDFDGDTLCLDSIFYPTSGFWKWVKVELGADPFVPDWGGPYCYQISNDSLPSGVKEAASGSMLPNTWTMSQNYPNPFNPTTEIAFDVPTRSYVTVTVFNVLGQKVNDLVDENLQAGSYTTTWDGRTANGTEVSSGVYFYRIESENFTQTKKMMLLK